MASDLRQSTVAGLVRAVPPLTFGSVDIGKDVSDFVDEVTVRGEFEQRSKFLFRTCPLTFKTAGLYSRLMAVDMASLVYQYGGGNECVTFKSCRGRNIVGIVQTELPRRHIYANPGSIRLFDEIQSADNVAVPTGRFIPQQVKRVFYLEDKAGGSFNLYA